MNQLFNELLDVKKLVKALFDKEDETKKYAKSYDPYKNNLDEYFFKLKKLKRERKKIKQQLLKLL